MTHTDHMTSDHMTRERMVIVAGFFSHCCHVKFFNSSLQLIVISSTVLDPVHHGLSTGSDPVQHGLSTGLEVVHVLGAAV